MNETFKYFLQPEKFAFILEGEHECAICHEMKSCFDGSAYYGEKEYSAFCFECVSKGRLKEVGAFAVDPDITSLKAQIIEKAPGLSEAEIETAVQEKTDELMNTTPKFPTWQDFAWPAHCGDYCQFIKLAGQVDFNKLAPEGNGKAFFSNTLYGDLKDITAVDDVWPDLPNEAISDIDDSNWSPIAYIFKCLHCDAYLTNWDCD